MSRNILLIEPPYKTKFPPLGLMKISSYHKELGDKVTFHKGLVKDVAWESWDRVYITTLFTFYWKATIKTINDYKDIVLRGDPSRLYVGGITASLMPNEIYEETGVTNIIKGVLNRPKMLDTDNSLIVDNMTPDYSLLDYPKHDYNLKDSYMGYATRGCPNKCKFCGVNTLEPDFIEYKGIKTLVEGIKKEFGEKQHLVLLDNNVLHSHKLKKIIKDIRDLGFDKKAKLNNKLRAVDFNQGVDARLFTDEKAKLLSTIAIRPLRIAFDSLKIKKRYEKAVRLAAKHGILNLSNYILYNYNDTPDDFWERLKINIDLNKELGTSIYSFPMKFIPLNHRDRSHVSDNWNWYFLRNVQRILNVLKGSVMTGEDFFYRAFGSSPEEFYQILHMPERILMFRSRDIGDEEKRWLRNFKKLSTNQHNKLLEILNENRNEKTLKEQYMKTKEGRLKDTLEFYFSDDESPLPLLSKSSTKIYQGVAH